MSKSSSSAAEGRPRIILLCGPTAVGKTALAVTLAKRYPLEIISADSRQVYRGMNIGTAKPTEVEREGVPHHLLDVVDPAEEFSVADFIRLADRAAAEIQTRGRIPLVVGGTGLYWQLLTEGLMSSPGADPELRQALEGLDNREGDGALYRLLQERDPVAAQAIPPGNRVRIVRALEVISQTGQAFSRLQREHGFSDRPYRVLKIGLFMDRQELYQRIDDRVVAMMRQGLEAEVRNLLDSGLGNAKAMKTIGYREMVGVLRGGSDREKALGLIQRNSRRYAKRQLTWMRRDKTMIWLDSSTEFVKICKLIENFIA
ncbi:MAG: tRNA (adenosine(37)-N6)-dimethylallyltransferase MiaA [Desulfuromonas sp.]|nr:MAG: tRNA (adenosine(37)-N6)-dimethylallyltransferase MiaA [Desulfuromonas sp.]